VPWRFFEVALRAQDEVRGSFSQACGLAQCDPLRLEGVMTNAFEMPLFTRLCSACLYSALVFCTVTGTSHAQSQPPPDRPAVTINGQTYTPRSILARNMGTEADRFTAFPPHRIAGDIYYVGTNTISSFLVATPQGHILIDSNYERNVPAIEKSVAQLGFKFEDIKIVLGNHAHADHQEGDALVKQMTGAQVMAMAEDVPALQAMKPGGKEHPIDRILHDGDRVTLGGTTLVAHLTPGHTHGCTTWTTAAEESGKTYNVMFGCSLRPPAVLTPALVEEFNRAFKTVRGLPCDIQLGDHGAQYNMQEKHAKMREGGSNPFIEPATCMQEADVEEAMFNAILADQQAARQ
jgi:metallo-beta-lactamase class B